MNFVVLNYQVVEWVDIFANPVFKNPGINIIARMSVYIRRFRSRPINSQFVVAYKQSSKTKEKSSWVISKVVAVAYGSVLFITKYKSQFKQFFCKGGRN